MNKRKSLFEIHTAVVLFGMAGLFGKWLFLSPVIIVLGRVFFASLALVAFLLISKQKISLPQSKFYLILFFLGLILSVHWISFFKAIQVSTVAVGLLSYSSFPIFTSLLEPLFCKERIERTNIFLAGLCVIGIFFIIPRFDINNQVFQGVLWGLLSGATFSILSILNRNLTRHLSSLIIAFYQDFFACLILSPFLFFIHPILKMESVLLLCFLGIFCTAGSHTLFIKGMKFIKAQTAAIISSLEPVYGILMALAFLNEIPTMRTILGGCVVLGSALLATWKGFKN